MTKKEVMENMVRVKTALAEKYERRTEALKSKPAKERTQRQAKRYRQQAANSGRSGSK